MTAFGISGLSKTPLNLPGPGRDQGQAPRCGTDPDEKRSAGQYRSHTAAERSAPDGHHHDPVRRAVGGGRGGAGADLEPLSFSPHLAAILLKWLADGDLSAGDGAAV